MLGLLLLLPDLEVFNRGVVQQLPLALLDHGVALGCLAQVGGAEAGRLVAERVHLGVEAYPRALVPLRPAQQLVLLLLDELSVILEIDFAEVEHCPAHLALLGEGLGVLLRFAAVADGCEDVLRWCRYSLFRMGWAQGFD